MRSPIWLHGNPSGPAPRRDAERVVLRGGEIVGPEPAGESGLQLVSGTEQRGVRLLFEDGRGRAGEARFWRIGHRAIVRDDEHLRQIPQT